MPMVVETPTQMLEEKMSLSSDAVVLHGSYVGTTSLPGTPGVVNVLAPVNLGLRASQLNALFTKYRFKMVRIDFFAGVSGSSGIAAFGILDDASGSEGDGPTTLSGVREMRTSAVNWFGQTSPTSFVWRPNDPSWRFTYPGSGDPRLVNSGVIYGAASTGVTVTYTLTYSVVFKGATDVGAQ
jgi:hypothetical protein